MHYRGCNKDKLILTGFPKPTRPPGVLRSFLLPGVEYLEREGWPAFSFSSSCCLFNEDSKAFRNWPPPTMGFVECLFALASGALPFFANSSISWRDSSTVTKRQENQPSNNQEYFYDLTPFLSLVVRFKKVPFLLSLLLISQIIHIICSVLETSDCWRDISQPFLFLGSICVPMRSVRSSNQSTRRVKVIRDDVLLSSCFCSIFSPLHSHGHSLPLSQNARLVDYNVLLLQGSTLFNQSLRKPSLMRFPSKKR